MYVYIQSESGLWTVGFYSPDGKWNPESDHETQSSAARRVRYLNGGNLNAKRPMPIYTSIDEKDDI